MNTSFHRRGLVALAGALAASGFSVSRAFAQDGDGANGLPPRPTPADWAKSPDLDNVCLSPQGRVIAFTQEKDDTKYLITHNFATGASQTFNIGPAKIGGVSWIDESHLLVSTFNTAKVERFSGGRETFTIATVYNIEKKTINTLFSQVDKTSARDRFPNFIVGGVNIITVDGQKQVTAATYPLDPTDDFLYLYRFDLDNNSKYKMMDRAGWDTDDWVMTPSGQLVARSSHSQKTGEWTLDFYTGSGWKPVYSETSRLHPPSLVGLADDGKSVLIYRMVDESGRYYPVGSDGVLADPLPDKGPRASLIYDPVTFLPSGWSYSEEGWSHQEYKDPARAESYAKARAAVEGYRMIVAAFADEDPRKLIIYTEGSDDAGSYYFIDFTTGQTVPIGVNYPNIDPAWITEKQAITYEAADGLQIEAYLTLPPNREAKNLPMVLLPHGGPQARDNISTDWQAQALASAGYVVLQPNYRGSSGYGKSFVDAGHGQIGRKMQTDLSDGVRHLVSQGMVDPKKVAIFGASYGGYAALAGATLDPGVYNCAIDVAGLSDLTSFLLWSDDYNQNVGHTGSWYYWTDYFGDPSTYASVSPLQNAGKCNIPVLVVHGKDDTVVPIDQSTKMVAALRAAGKDVTYIQYDHEDHWETNEKARTDMMRIIMDFLMKHNPV